MFRLSRDRPRRRDVTVLLSSTIYQTWRRARSNIRRLEKAGSLLLPRASHGLSKRVRLRTARISLEIFRPVETSRRVDF